MWNEYNCVVVWSFFGIALLWDWNKKWHFPVLWPCWVFQICWHIEWSTLIASFFRIWNSSAGIPSPLLALFVVMLPKAYLTSHSRMSGSRWVITPLWLSWSLRVFWYSSSVYSCHLLKKAECQRIDGFEFCGAGEVSWESLGLQGDQTSPSQRKLITPEYSLEGLMLKLKRQYFGHLMQRANSLKKTLMMERLKAQGEGGGGRWWDG